MDEKQTEFQVIRFMFHVFSPTTGLFSQESLEKDDDEILRIPREHLRTPEELHAAYAKFFPEIFEFNDRFLRVSNFVPRTHLHVYLVSTNA